MADQLTFDQVDVWIYPPSADALGGLRAFRGDWHIETRYPPSRERPWEGDQYLMRRAADNQCFITGSDWIETFWRKKDG